MKSNMNVIDINEKRNEKDEQIRAENLKYIFLSSLHALELSAQIVQEVDRNTGCKLCSCFTEEDKEEFITHLSGIENILGGSYLLFDEHIKAEVDLLKSLKVVFALMYGLLYIPEEPMNPIEALLEEIQEELEQE